MLAVPDRFLTDNSEDAREHRPPQSVSGPPPLSRLVILTPCRSLQQCPQSSAGSRAQWFHLSGPVDALIDG
jgi:hypothetical protein